MYNLENYLFNRDADLALFSDLVDYHSSVSELPMDEQYHLLALWVLHTYLIDGAQFSPIITLVAGEPERGIRNRTGKGLIYVCRRGVWVDKVRPAVITRIAERFQVSIFLNLKDFATKSPKGDWADLILNRFQRGMTTAKVIPGGKGFDDIKYFSVFGPTVLASDVPVDSFIESRGLSIGLKKSERVFHDDVTPENCLELKERLTSFRARYYPVDMPMVEKQVPGRLGDALRPLHQMVLLVFPELEKRFVRFMKSVQRDSIEIRPRCFMDRVLYTVLELACQSQKDIIPVKTIAATLAGEENPTLSMCQRVGRVLSRLGFEKTRVGRNGNMAIVLDRLWIEKLKGK